jgi:hypothetical protein
MKIFDLTKKLIGEILSITPQFDALSRKINEAKLLTAKSLISQVKAYGIYENIQETEFKVFSQFEDDGIIQYLINNIDVSEKKFIEFGVENYTESNTRFLLINNNWKGLVIDINKADIDYIKNDEIYWMHDLTAIHAQVDKDNINQIISVNRFAGKVGILSIDIDGNDYWIWECINVVEPDIVIVEYNSILGCDRAVTIPYDPTFNRSKAHYSNLYWGCSLKALYLLAKRKGYVFVGSNSAGNNAYFVKKEKIGNIKTISLTSGFVKSQFRQSRNTEGRLSYVSHEDCLEIIKDMYIYDIEKDALLPIKEI